MFSEAHAAHAVAFIENLPQTIGQWAGKPLKLEPWQRDEIIRPLFGTLNDDGTRQYRTAYIEIPRKNGKSTLAAGVANFLLYADNEPGAQIYGAAYSKDQAGIVFREAKNMVLRSPALLRRSKVLDAVKNIAVPGTDSFYRAIPAEAASSHGFNAHGIIFDELHTQATRELWDVLTTSTGARLQPLTFAITTAGFDRLSICYEQHLYAIGLLKLRGVIPEDWYKDIPRAVIDDPSFFAYVKSIPEDWDWQDEKNWHIANPALGTFRSLDEMRAKAHEAAQIPAAQNKFRRLYLNQWTSTETRWLDMAAWDRSAGHVDAEALRGRQCYAGVDLSATTDLTACALVFPFGDSFKALVHFWIPGDGLEDRSRRDRVPYAQWIEDGFVTATPGESVKYGFVRKWLENAGKTYKIEEIAFDKFGGFEIWDLLSEAGFNMVDVRQNFANMGPASRDFERALLERRIEHGGNPVLRWNADNVVVLSDENENIRPVKKRSKQRIDGIVALIMALDRAQRRGGTSVYDTREVRILG